MTDHTKQMHRLIWVFAVRMSKMLFSHTEAKYLDTLPHNSYDFNKSILLPVDES